MNSTAAEKLAAVEALTWLCSQLVEGGHPVQQLYDYLGRTSTQQIAMHALRRTVAHRLMIAKPNASAVPVSAYLARDVATARATIEETITGLRRRAQD